MTVSRVSHPLQGGHAQDTLDTDTKTPRLCPEAEDPASYVFDPVRLMSDEVFTAWMQRDDRSRSELMSRGKQRLAMTSKRRR